MDDKQKTQVVFAWQEYQKSVSKGTTSEQEYRDEFIARMQNEFGGVLSQTYGDSYGWDANVEWDDIEKVLNTVIDENFGKCDFSIDGVSDDFEVIDGSVMSCDDIQAIEDKYPGIFTTPNMSINMKVVPLDNHPMHFCNLDFTKGIMPVPIARDGGIWMEDD